MRYHFEALDEGHPWRRIASFELQSDAEDCRHVLGAKHEIWRLVMDSIRHGSVLMMESRGADPNKAEDNRTVQAFRTDSLRELKKIKLDWPELNYATAKGVLILSPSKPAIAPTTGPQRLVE